MIVDIRGKVRGEHPKAFETIDVFLTIESPDVTEDEVRRAIETAEGKICPVVAMVRGNVQLKVDFKVEAT